VNRALSRGELHCEPLVDTAVMCVISYGRSPIRMSGLGFRRRVLMTSVSAHASREVSFETARRKAAMSLAVLNTRSFGRRASMSPGRRAPLGTTNDRILPVLSLVMPDAEGGEVCR